MTTISSDTEERLLQTLARISGFLELIEHDLRAETMEIHALEEALYTIALMHTSGSTPNLKDSNRQVRAWLDAKYREETPTP